MAIIFTGSKAITKICSEIKNDLFAQREEQPGVVAGGVVPRTVLSDRLFLYASLVCQNVSRVTNFFSRRYLSKRREVDTAPEMVFTL